MAPKKTDKTQASKEAAPSERFVFASAKDTLTHNGKTYRGACPMKLAQALGLTKQSDGAAPAKDAGTV